MTLVAESITTRTQGTLRHWPLAALAALTLLRLAVAARVPLVPDEAYYWVWSRALAPGYPDHPPMVALWIQLGTLLVGDTALGIRLLGPISVALASLLLADAADRLLPGRDAGLRAAAFLNATMLVGAGAVLMTPDAPLLAFWIAALWALARLLHSGSPFWWLVVGLFAGLAMASKYTAALLWFGIVLWLLATPSWRRWVKHPLPWLGALLALAIFLPVVCWEAAHGWVSFARQGGRVGVWQPVNVLRFLGELVAGQAGLATPLIFVFCVAGVVMAVRQAWRTRDPAWTLLVALTVPAAVLFAEHTFGDRVQGNWPAIIYPAAVIAAAGLQGPTWQRLRTPALVLGFGITLLAYGQAVFAPLPARLDPTARYLDGWAGLAADIDAVRREAGASFIACDQYGVAAELARLLPQEVPVIGAEPRWGYVALPPAHLGGRTGILVRNAGHGSVAFGPWSDVTEIGLVERKRGSDVIETFRLFRATATAEPAVAAVVLPRR